MDFNKQNMQKILMIVAFGVILFWGLQNLDSIHQFMGGLLTLLFPFLLGAAIAFIMNVPMKMIEKVLFTSRSDKYEKIVRSIARPVSIVLSIVLIAGIIFIVIFMIVPELLSTFQIIAKGIPDSILKFQKWILSFNIPFPELREWLINLEVDWNSIGVKLFSWIQSGAGSVLTSTFTVASTLISGFVNFFLGFIFAIYILFQKEKLGSQARKLGYAVLKEKTADRVVEIGVLANKTFSNFISGQCTEAVILGVLFFIAMSIFRMPYTLTVSVLIGFLSLIPIFGAFMGCVIGAFLILMRSPMQAIAFVVLFNVIQQFEGNIIYPRVVGGSVGLPSIWVLVAVTLGGSLMGVVGMLIFIPLSSVLYALLRGFVNQKLKVNRIPKRKYDIDEGGN